MILIITQEADYSTNMVIDWLHFFGLDWVRINENDILDISFAGEDIKVNHDLFNFLLSEITAVWYRRGMLNFKFNDVEDKNINDFRKIELSKIREFFYYKLSLLPHINRYTNSDVNKLIVNDIAKKCGLIVPKDYLVSESKSLSKIQKTKKLATKSVSGNTMFNYEEFYFIGYTSMIKDPEKNPETFFPSLVQNYIKKKYELRIFYLHRKFWSMAIFSQEDEQTSVDFRNYNKKKPNRNVPYKLPFEVERKLIDLMEKLKLNSGSIDMIVTNDNEFVFLEVNPIGQFGMVSNPCNYYLHREIAHFFKVNNKNKD